MQSPLSEPEPATVTSENPLTIRYDQGVISFAARHLGHYTPKTGDRVLACYHHGTEDQIVLGLITESPGMAAEHGQPEPVVPLTHLQQATRGDAR